MHFSDTFLADGWKLLLRLMNISALAKGLNWSAYKYGYNEVELFNYKCTINYQYF